MKKKIYFSKMHGLGNDFVIINGIERKVFFCAEMISNLSDRKKGIGFDQMLIIKKSKNINIDFYCQIFNANGNEVFQCGNGMRCVAQFLYLKKITNKKIIKISTKFNKLILFIISKEIVCVNMGIPEFEPKKIPFKIKKNKKVYFVKIKRKKIFFSVVSIGNPHCILYVNNINTTKVNLLGSVLEKHPLFPKKTNVGFMQVINKKNIKLRVYERDLGETNACGSGACAAVAVGIKNGFLKKKYLLIYLVVN